MAANVRDEFAKAGASGPVPVHPLPKGVTNRVKDAMCLPELSLAMRWCPTKRLLSSACLVLLPGLGQLHLPGVLTISG